jgi:hypothetical protein
MSASNWVRGVVNNADRNRTQEPVDVRVPRTIEAQPELDPEAAAIDAIVFAVRPLSEEARTRVLNYIAARFPPHKFED